MLTSRVTKKMITALELTANRPEMVRSILELIMADTIVSLIEDNENYSYLIPLFIQPSEDIVTNYKQVTAGIFLFDEYRQLLSLIDQLIDNIGADLFTNMVDTDENSAYSEILRCFGHGVSFWDNHNYQDFGFSEMPQLKKTFENPHNVASQILNKIAEANPDEEEETEDPDFEQWLAENYEHSGREYYLSKNPNDYLMYEWHILKDKWESESFTSSSRYYQAMSNFA